MSGGVRSVILSAYGMKICLNELSMFDNIREPINPPLSQFDAGINCDTDYVPIFDLENGHEGEIFPMLLEGWGSVCLPLTTSEQYEVTLKCYPRVVHVLKLPE